jgi:hypothetical protein
MAAFHQWIQELELSEIHINGCCYIWSNEREHPTLKHIDHVFACLAWSNMFPVHNLQALSTSAFDHTPLLLYTNINSPIFRHFKFESIWPKMPGYLEVVEASWSCDIPNADTFRKLDLKFHSTVKALRSWSQKQVDSVRLQFMTASEIISKLDRAQEFRQLAPEELELCKVLKFKSLVLVSLACTIARQWSRITFLSEGDANSPFLPPSGVSLRSEKFHRSSHSSRHNPHRGKTKIPSHL